jgi:hypothetical protein
MGTSILFREPGKEIQMTTHNYARFVDASRTFLLATLFVVASAQGSALVGGRGVGLAAGEGSPAVTLLSHSAVASARRYAPIASA